MIHKDKLWIKFEELDIVCFCAYNNRRCPAQKRECGLYLAKFIQIENPEILDHNDEERRKIERLEKRLNRENKKFRTEIQRNIDKMKKFKI